MSSESEFHMTLTIMVMKNRATVIRKLTNIFRILTSLGCKIVGKYQIIDTLTKKKLI